MTKYYKRKICNVCGGNNVKDSYFSCRCGNLILRNNLRWKQKVVFREMKKKTRLLLWRINALFLGLVFIVSLPILLFIALSMFIGSRLVPETV